ncbi:MAG: myxosortase MrtC [Sandaracinaceae bacterium]
MGGRTPDRIDGEVLAVVGGMAIGVFAVAMAERHVAALRGLDGLLVATLFLVTAIALARREPDGLRRYGIDLGGLLEAPAADDERPAGPLGLYDLARALRRALPAGLRELGVAVAVALVVFPAFSVAYALWHQVGPPRSIDLPPDLEAFALSQVLVVALPEEALFRGYVQTRLADAHPPRHRVLGVRLSLLAWIGSAVLFALVHLASDPRPDRLAVFVPGLLFGWLRAWRGGIGAAVLVHAMSNVLAEVLARTLPIP